VVFPFTQVIVMRFAAAGLAVGEGAGAASAFGSSGFAEIFSASGNSSSCAS